MVPLFTLSLLLLASLTLLPGSHQLPLNVVFQPLTYQMNTLEKTEPGFIPVSSSSKTIGSISKTEDPSNQLICKKIHHGESIVRLSPLQQENKIFFIPSSMLQAVSESPFLRFYVTTPSPGISFEDMPSEIPEGIYAASHPFMASLCVTEDSPRPFPVLFVPPPPSSYDPIENDFRKEIPTKPLDNSLFLSRANDLGKLSSLRKLSINTPSGSGVTLGLHGVPATVESSSPSTGNPEGQILIKLHTNPPGSISVSPTGEAKLASLVAPTNFNMYRGEGLVTHSASPAVSLVFSRPVGSIGIGSTNSPAVNIERQNIVSSNEKYPMRYL